MDMSDELMTVVTWASNALVTAMVTDAWAKVRGKVARLFGRGQSDSTTLRLLDTTREQIDKAGPADLQRVQTEQAEEWTVRFKDLLKVHPDAESEVRGLPEEIRSMLPPGSIAAFDHSMASMRDISVVGYGGITGGIVHIEGAPPGPWAPGRP